MKLILKNLKQKQFNVEVESDKVTVKDLKLAIEKAHGFDASLIKLLHNGRVLEDTKTLEEYTIKEENVVVMMNTKVKPSNPPPAEPKKEPEASGVKPMEVEPPQQPQPQPQPEISKESIDALVDMGYEKAKVELALRNAHGSIDQAIELLNSGMDLENPPQTGGASSGSQNQPQPAQSGSQGPVDTDLKKNAAILKIICAKEPTKLIELLDSIKRRKPDLAQKIKQNSDEFRRLLIAPISQEDINIYKEFQIQTNMLLSGGRRPGQVTITLTREEGEAVKRLRDLGNFSQEEVLQAYIACDKNEEATANYLFEQKWKEDNDNNK